MNCIISSDKLYKDTVAKELFDFLRESLKDNNDYTLYYEYPIYMDVDEKILTPKFLIISPVNGVFIINCSPEKCVSDIQALDDETTLVENYIFSRFIKSSAKNLKISKRELSFDLRSVLFLPIVSSSEINNLNIENIACSKKEEILSLIQQSGKNISQDMQKEISAILEGSRVVLKPKKRMIEEGDTKTKGYILKQMEEQIAYLDLDQKNAALAQIVGPQRIRGLAGSGKTIILCMKAALIHLKEPDKKILYTFTTKSLYDYIETLIVRFYRFFGDGSLPDLDNRIHIKHSWGGGSVPGVYYSTCRNNDIFPLTFDQAKLLPFSDPFDAVCENLLLKTKGKLKKEYDYVLIDEAQDFRPSFYQLCRAIVRDDCLVWCYDDLQNIFDVKIQDTIATFQNKYGAEGIDLGKLNEQYEDLNNDVVLARTYRNPREILVLAHAIGFGIYNDALIQTLENNQHWEDFGYQVVKGNSREGDKMEIIRPKENSPLVISDLQKPEEIIEITSYDSMIEEINGVAESIKKNIDDDKLRPDDIIVISLDDKNSKMQLKILSDALRQKSIETFNLTDRYYSKGFMEEGCVSLSTVYRAKGNEAAQVYVIGTQVFESNSNRRSMRNRIFTAFTRAKGWLNISGVHINDGKLFKEIKMVFENNFTLKFIQNKPKYIIERNKQNTRKKKKAKEMVKELMKLDLSKDEINAMLEEYKVD